MVTISMLGQTTRLEVENKGKAAAAAAGPAPVDKKLTVFGPDGKPVTKQAEKKDTGGTKEPAPPKPPPGGASGAERASGDGAKGEAAP